MLRIAFLTNGGTLHLDQRRELAVADESIQPNDELGAEVVSGAETAGPSMKVAIIGISLVVMVVAIAVGFRFLDLRQPAPIPPFAGHLFQRSPRTPPTSRSQSRST